MKKRILPILLAVAMLITAFSGCSVFNDLADEILGSAEPLPTAPLSETYDPAKLAAEEEAAAKAARTAFSPEEIGNVLTQSLVQITAFDMNGNEKNRGTGFFFPGGVLTSLDVMRGASSATLTVYDGGVYQVTGIRFYDEDMNICILACGKQNAPDLEPAKWGVEASEPVYAVGFGGAVTQGAVVSASQFIGNYECVQTSAYIDSSVAGGPLVNAYGELLGMCCMNISEDGQNYAVSASTLSVIDKSQLISIEDFRKAVGAPAGEGTQVVTGDSGEKVYEKANFTETESNNSVAEATALQIGYWTAAYVNKEGNAYGGEEGALTEDGREMSSKDMIEDSLDVFAFTIESEGTIEVIAQPAYDVDVAQLDPTLVINEEMEHLANDDGEAIGYFRSDEIDGLTCQAATADVKPGTYYIAVKLLDGWEQSIGCYYKIKVNFTAKDAQG